MDDESDAAAERPTFRGCVFCYAGEWAYYGAQRTLGTLTSSTD